MATFYVKSGAGAVPLANQAWVNGDKMVPTLADATANVNVARRWVWETTTAGTSTGTPTWSASVTQDVTTVTQNGVVWTARKPGFSSGTTANWTYATIYLAYTGSTVGMAASGDTFYVSNNHAESQAALYDIFSIAGTNTICVDDSVAPPTSVATTATVTTTGGNLSIGVSTSCYVYGIVFICGSAAVVARNLTISGGLYESCSFQLASTATSSMLISTTNWINCTVKFGAAGSSLRTDTVPFAWNGGSLLSGGTSPTNLLGTNQRDVTIRGVDLSNASAGINFANNTTVDASVKVFDCKMPTSWSGALNAGVPTGLSYWFLTNTDATGTNYTMQSKSQYGSIVQDTSIYRTGGASNGVTNLSWKITTTASAGLFPQKFMQTPEIVKWFPITGFAVGNPVTVTLHFIRDNVTAMNDDEIWSEAMYLSSASAPLGTLITNAKASILASAGAQPSDSSATWVGTGGFSNPNKQKLVLTFTPNLAGIIHIVVKVCKASVTALYLDPQVDFS